MAYQGLIGAAVDRYSARESSYFDTNVQLQSLRNWLNTQQHSM